MTIIHRIRDNDERTRQRRRKYRRRRLRSIAVLPSLFTMGNLILGFAVIHFAAQQEFTLACYLLILAMACDVLDGRIARMTRRTSDFGGQLDSLADIVSFGIAPAFLVICIFAHTLESPKQVSPFSDQILGRTAWVLSAMYVACAALRLARFNVEHKDADASHMGFRGLPSPAAAATIGSLVLFHEAILKRASIKEVDSVLAQPLIYSLPLIALLVGLLMVSRVPYMHMANALFRGRRPFWQVVLMVGGIIGLFIFPQLLLAVMACTYTLAGVIRYAANKLAHPPTATAQTDPEATQNAAAPATIETTHKTG